MMVIFLTIANKGATSFGAGYFCYPEDYFEKICQKNEDSKMCSYEGGIWGMYIFLIFIYIYNVYIRNSPKTMLT
jgi:hypothetical protein